jgi:hypothetical protein
MSDGTSNPARYFGQQVRRARRAAGWTLAEFGQRIGYDPTALKFSGLWGLVSGFPGLVTVWLHVGRGGVTGCGGP